MRGAAARPRAACPWAARPWAARPWAGYAWAGLVSHSLPRYERVRIYGCRLVFAGKNRRPCRLLVGTRTGVLHADLGFIRA